MVYVHSLGCLLGFSNSMDSVFKNKRLKYKKMDNRFDNIIDKVLSEIKRQDDKWGKDRDNHPLVWGSILQEEVGELAKEINDADFQTKKLSDNYETELVQIASVCFQAILNIDIYKNNS